MNPAFKLLFMRPSVYGKFLAAILIFIIGASMIWTSLGGWKTVLGVFLMIWANNIKLINGGEK